MHRGLLRRRVQLSIEYLESDELNVRNRSILVVGVRGSRWVVGVLTIGFVAMTSVLVRRGQRVPGLVTGLPASDRRWPWNRPCRRCSWLCAFDRWGPRNCKNLVCYPQRPPLPWTPHRHPACKLRRTDRCWTGTGRRSVWRRSAGRGLPTPPTSKPSRQIPAIAIWVCGVRTIVTK